MAEVTIPMSKKEYDSKLEAITLCGKNRAPHAYVPVEWVKNENTEYVSMFMCLVCFKRVKTKTLYKNFEELNIIKDS